MTLVLSPIFGQTQPSLPAQHGLVQNEGSLKSNDVEPPFACPFPDINGHDLGYAPIVSGRTRISKPNVMANLPSQVSHVETGALPHLLKTPSKSIFSLGKMTIEQTYQTWLNLPVPNRWGNP